MSYIGITEVQSNPFSPLTAELVKQLRDNPIAIAEGAAGAPRVQGRAIANVTLDEFTGTYDDNGYGVIRTIIDLEYVDRLLFIGSNTNTQSITVKIAYRLSTDNGSSYGSFVDVTGDGTSKIGVISIDMSSGQNAIQFALYRGNSTGSDTLEGQVFIQEAAE